MRCEEFQLARVSDDPAEQLSAGRHAAECTECAGWLEEHSLRDRMILLKGSRGIGLEKLLGIL